MLLGLIRPDAGTIAVLGHDPQATVRRGLVGAMQQEGGTANRVTVGETRRLP